LSANIYVHDFFLEFKSVKYGYFIPKTQDMRFFTIYI